MKKHILTACALAASSLMFAQGYQAVVTTQDGEKHVYSTAEVNKIEFNEAPQYINTPCYLGGRYDPISAGARYTLTMATSTPDSGGDPAQVGDLQLTVVLVGERSEEAHNAVLPDGYYRSGSATAPGTWDLSRSGLWIRLEEGPQGVEPSFFIEGTADVRHTDNGEYDVRVEGLLLSGTQVAVRYTGPMTFTPGTGAAGDFDTDQDITFEGGQGRYWANWFVPFADDMSAQFYTGTFNENNTQVEGYWLNLDMYMSKHANPESMNPVRLDDGVYTIDSREEVSDNLYLPMTFRPGDMMDFFGTEYVTGTYLTYTRADGQRSQALITGGDFTVSQNGTKIDFNLVASNGISITGTYSGTPYIVNYCDNSSDPGVPDTLTGDHVLDFLPNTEAYDFNMGEMFIPGLYSHILMVTEPDMEHGDYLQMDLLSSTEQLSDGVYTFDDSMTDLSGLKGRVNYGGGLVFSWYGDLDSTDADGYQDTLSPIAGGTMTISTVSAGNRKLVFDLTTGDGHKLTGEWTGPMDYIDINETEKPARKLGNLKSGLHPQHNTSPIRRKAVTAPNVRTR